MTRALCIAALLALTACQTTQDASPTAPPIERIEPAKLSCPEIREARRKLILAMAAADEATKEATAAKIVAGQIPFAGGVVGAAFNAPWYQFRGAVIDFARLDIEMERCPARAKE